MPKNQKPKKPVPAQPDETRAPAAPAFLVQKEQLREIVFLSMAAVAVHLLLLYLCPSPAACADSYHYLTAVNNQQPGVYRPYGYSIALDLMKVFSSGAYFVFLVQYVLHFASSVCFAYTIKFLFRPESRKERTLFLGFTTCVLFSPAILYLSNYIISDSIFISLTMLWAATLLLLLRIPKIPYVLLHCAVLFILLWVRYSGLFYPLFSIVAIGFAFRGTLSMTLAVLPLMITGYMVAHTRAQMKEIYRTPVFSAFSGWQLANNALHIIPYTDLKPGFIRDPELRKIHRAALEMPDSVYVNAGLTDAYMWDQSKPLKRYFSRYIEDHDMEYLVTWAKASVPMNDYGKLLIVKYPLQFMRHFLLPNAREVFLPHWTEMLEHAELIRDKNNGWFDLSHEDKIASGRDVFKRFYFPVLPFLFFCVWLVLGAALAFYFLRLRQDDDPVRKNTIAFLLLFMLVYVVFHICVAPIAIRYMLVIHAMQVALIYIVALAFMRQRNDPAGS